MRKGLLLLLYFMSIRSVLGVRAVGLAYGRRRLLLRFKKRLALSFSWRRFAQNPIDSEPFFPASSAKTEVTGRRTLAREICCCALFLITDFSHRKVHLRKFSPKALETCMRFPSPPSRRPRKHLSTVSAFGRAVVAIKKGPGA